MHKTVHPALTQNSLLPDHSDPLMFRLQSVLPFHYECQYKDEIPYNSPFSLTHRLVLYTLEAGDCLFCVQTDNHLFTAGY